MFVHWDEAVTILHCYWERPIWKAKKVNKNITAKDINKKRLKKNYNGTEYLQLHIYNIYNLFFIYTVDICMMYIYHTWYTYIYLKENE